MVMWPELAPHGARLDIETEKGIVRVDASDGDFRVDTPTRGVWELGASQAGLRAVMKLAREELALWPSRSQESALHDALFACLRASSSSQEWTAVCSDVDAIRRTPLLHARELRAAPHLVSDATRFRPCRVAIALIEDDDDDGDATPERVEALVAKLSSWRDLYAKGVGGKATRAVNATLAHHGEALSHDALWGLRNVELSRKAASLAHAELLGLLGAHPRALRLRTHMQLVEACSVDEMRALFERAPSDARTALVNGHDDRPAAILAELLASVAIPVTSRAIHLKDAYQAALRHAVEQVPASTKTARPPIPLPMIRGVRFLETMGDLVDEGRRMNHCVATRRGAAAAGECFVFAIDDGVGGFATVQVDAQGRVVESRGPKNRDNSTSSWARRALSRWGRGFWAVRVGLGEKIWHHSHSVLPQHCAPLDRVEDAYRVYARAAHEMPDDDGALAQWFSEHTSRAVRRELSLAVDTRPTKLPFAVALSPAGEVLSTSDAVWTPHPHPTQRQSEKMM